MPVYTLTILCAAALVVWTYSQDRYEKEPLRAILIAVAAGFGMMWIIGKADDFAIQTLGLSGGIVRKAATIALIEEGGKLLTLLLLAHFVLKKQFNDPMDGLIYGRLTGVGMAVQESMLYLGLAAPSLQTLGIEIVRLFAHSLMASLIGFAIGIGARPGAERQRYPRLVVLCLALSTTMHFGWNVIAYSRQTDLLSRIMPMWLMLVMMLVWRWFCNIAQERSHDAFKPLAGPLAPATSPAAA